MVAHRQSTSAADPERAYNERSAPDWLATHTSHPLPSQCRNPRRRLSEKDRRVTWELLISFLSSSSSFLCNPVQQIAMGLFGTCVFVYIGRTPTSIIFLDLRVRAWTNRAWNIQETGPNGGIFPNDSFQPAFLARYLTRLIFPDALSATIRL